MSKSNCVFPTRVKSLTNPSGVQSRRRMTPRKETHEYRKGR